MHRVEVVIPSGEGLYLSWFEFLHIPEDDFPECFHMYPSPVSCQYPGYWECEETHGACGR